MANGQVHPKQQQLGMMEGEVKEIQMELAAIRKNRMDLHIRQQKPFEPEADEGVPDSAFKDDVTKYLDDEVKDIPQIAKLREQLIRAKNSADVERFQREKYEARLRDLEGKLNGICCAAVLPEKDTPKGTNSEIAALKNRVRDLNDEIEELKIAAADKSEQLEEYRAKYLQAQQQVEELRRQMEVIDFDNRQVSDQIQVEIQKMKMQFQSKLQELAPLPELLAGARAQLHEARQLQALAEDGARHLAQEIRQVNDKLVVAVNGLNQEKADKSKLLEENQRLQLTADEQRAEIEELSRNVDDFKCQVLRYEEKLSQQEARHKEKAAECSHLLQELEAQRGQAARALARGRERADGARRYLQTQVSELERQLVQSRAHARACQKERDETRQRVQIQINNLQESFELVEIRLRALQNQVTSLKSSYTLILADDEETADTNKIATP